MYVLIIGAETGEAGQWYRAGWSAYSLQKFEVVFFFSSYLVMEDQNINLQYLSMNIFCTSQSYPWFWIKLNRYVDSEITMELMCTNIIQIIY